MHMKYSFSVKTRINGVFFEKLGELASKEGSVDSEKKYNAFLGKIIFLIKKYHKNKPQGKNPLFKKEIKLIETQKPLSEKTAWGGVNLKQVDVEKDFIRKLLVIRQFGCLGFEIHKFKIEKLNVLEGECLIIRPGQKKGNTEFFFAQKGDKFEFFPGDEHGVIALTDCVIEETSTNHLDDLIFIFNSKQII
jgi:hypothetical protein